MEDVMPVEDTMYLVIQAILASRCMRELLVILSKKEYTAFVRIPYI